MLLFYCMFLLPFQVTVFGVTIPIPDWIKATFGLSLPVMANVSEIVRGAMQSIPTAQWESAASLAFTRRQTLWMIILPQCIKRMLPPWMNLYAILTMATVLTSIVGVNEMMTLTRPALSAENRPGLLLSFYSYVLLLVLPLLLSDRALDRASRSPIRRRPLSERHAGSQRLARSSASATCTSRSATSRC